MTAFLYRVTANPTILSYKLAASVAAFIQSFAAFLATRVYTFRAAFILCVKRAYKREELYEPEYFVCIYWTAVLFTKHFEAAIVRRLPFLAVSPTGPLHAVFVWPLVFSKRWVTLYVLL